MIATPSPSNPDDVYAELADLNPTAYVATGFEKAYIGYTLGVRPSVAVYDYDKCVSVLMDRDGMTHEEAIEYLDFNTVYAWVGEGSPLYLIRREND